MSRGGRGSIGSSFSLSGPIRSLMVIRHSWQRLLGESRYREQFPFTPLCHYTSSTSSAAHCFTLKRLQELLYSSTRGRQFQGSLVIIVSEIDISAEFQQERHLLSTILPDCCMQGTVTLFACIYFGSWQHIMPNSGNWERCLTLANLSVPLVLWCNEVICHMNPTQNLQLLKTKRKVTKKK